MLQNKHRMRVVCGIGLLFVAVPQLPLEISTELHAIFSFSWLVLALLMVAANWRRMLKLDLLERWQKEARRREQWMEAEKMVKRTTGRNRQERNRSFQTV